MIVGIGLPKTGTQTLKRALEILGVDNEVGDYVHLMDTYPDGKYILTVRKDTETWYKSVLRWNKKKNGFKHSRSMREQRLMMYGSEQPTIHWKSKYEAHNRALERLPNCLKVCWENGDGWEEICTFLNKPIPDKEFPWLNKNK